jgi:hypothetical protein
VGLGVQVFDASGNLLIDVTTRLSRVIGTQTITAGSSGSLAVPNATQGQIWWAISPSNGSRYVPLISISGNTISWSTNTSYPNGPVDSLLIYGLY